ncbi:hypothetical protein [Streptomyces sp. NPDC051014]|uniref:hypothetical protein n=1 Tax=Streptomyces sp. NPDC051014 TaxID=3155751 RepID=UPI0033C0FA73
MDATLQQALSNGLISLGDPEPVPEYEHGRGKWRYVEGQEGKPITITDAGLAAWLDR